MMLTGKDRKGGLRPSEVQGNNEDQAEEPRSSLPQSTKIAPLKEPILATIIACHPYMSAAMHRPPYVMACEHFQDIG